MIAQLAIACTGVIAVALTQFGNARGKRAACLFGLAAQPFWLYSTISAEQWGMVAICCLYTLTWGWAVWKFHVEPWRQRTRYTCHACARRDVRPNEVVAGAYFLFHRTCGQTVHTALGKLANTGDLQ